MKELIYYYPLWDDSLKLTAEGMIDYLTKKNDELSFENETLKTLIKEIRDNTRVYKKVR